MNEHTPHLRKQRGQMSEALPNVACLTLSGGLQDAYSYCVRGKVYANAQTGNIILMSQQFFARNWMGGLSYLIPLSAFLCGVVVTESLRVRFQNKPGLHWRQLVVLVEILLLYLVGFLPNELDFLANAMVSFTCAMQVQAFRKMHGNVYASTMCIGNLRSGTESFGGFLRTRNMELLKKSGRYFGLVGIFALGAGVGSCLTSVLGTGTIWVSCALLMVSFGLMFLKPEPEGN